MPLSAVSVLVVAQSSSEIPEGLMNNPVCINTLQKGDNDDDKNKIIAIIIIIIIIISRGDCKI